MDEVVFKIWTGENASQIDSFEVFAGLVVYSSLSLDEKINCEVKRFI